MIYIKSRSLSYHALACTILLLSFAEPALARKENTLIENAVLSTNGGGTYAFNNDFINATVKNGDSLVLLPGCNDNCEGDNYFYATADGTLVTGQGSELRVGGTATNTTVENGAMLTVGQAGLGAVVGESMRWDTFPATVTDSIIKNGGIEKVLAGGQAIGSTIETGGKQYVFVETGKPETTNDKKGGTAIDTKINGGTQYVYGTGSQAIGSTINDNGTQWVYNSGAATQAGGGYAKDTTINAGIQRVYGVGSNVDNTRIESAGTQYIYKQGTANKTLINGGLQVVYEQGTATGSQLENNGLQYVYNKGSVTDTKVNSGTQYVYLAGSATNTTVNGGAQKAYGAGTTVTNNIINKGGLQQIWDNALAVNNTIHSGGSQIINKDGVIKDTTVDGGYSSLYDGASSQGKLDVINQGTLMIETSANQTTRIENASIDSQSKVNLVANSNLTGTSFANIANLDNNGVVSFSDAKLGDNTPINSFSPITLKVGTLTGNGTYAMHADIGNQVGDLLQINQLGSNSYNKLFIANNGASNAKVTDKLTVVATQNGGDAKQFSLSNQVEQGGYLFGLRQEGNDWVLCAETNCTKATAGGGAGSAGTLTSTAQAAGNFLNISYLMSYVNTQNLMQRMGDLRDSNNTKDVDVWMRGFAGKLNSFTGNLGGFDMNYRGTQIGADKLFNLSSGTLRTGAAIGYIDADPNYRDGHGSAKSYNFGLYGTYVDNRNFYVDTLLKYEQIKNDFTVTDTQNNKVSGHAKSAGYGLSVETGKRFYLQQANEGIYLEPQAQLSYMHQEGDTVHASNGLKVKLSDYDSTLGRLSTAIGYEIKQGANPVNVYFKTGYVREFMGNNINYYLNKSKEQHNFKGNFWDNELGISTTINKSHTFHADLHYANGNRFDQQQINVGYRYQF